ncbi:MAG: superoxide dismutase [Novosphingobium sp.]
MFTLPPLPYSEDALAPHISELTLSLHYGKHHKGYVDALNKLLEDNVLADLSLTDIIQRSHGYVARLPIFNDAAQSWNHEFFWNSMKPGGGGAPEGAILAKIKRYFGDTKAFGDEFAKIATAHFGSGWIWLVVKDGMLAIVTTHDADLPLLHGETALLCCDLWEHAYYLDYQNRRAEFISSFLDHLANWDFANANLAAALANQDESMMALEHPDMGRADI